MEFIDFWIGFWIYEFMNLWIFRFMDLWIYRYMHRFIHIRSFEFIYLRICGYTSVLWIYRCMYIIWIGGFTEL